jgi:hypothetical protein
MRDRQASNRPRGSIPGPETASQGGTPRNQQVQAEIQLHSVQAAFLASRFTPRSGELLPPAGDGDSSCRMPWMDARKLNVRGPSGRQSELRDRSSTADRRHLRGNSRALPGNEDDHKGLLPHRETIWAKICRHDPAQRFGSQPGKQWSARRFAMGDESCERRQRSAKHSRHGRMLSAARTAEWRR